LAVVAKREGAFVRKLTARMKRRSGARLARLLRRGWDNIQPWEVPMIRLILLPALLLMPCWPAIAAAPFEDVDALDAEIADRVGVGVAQPIDRRLKLKTCRDGVSVDPPAQGALSVRCVSEGWRIRVPLVQAVATDTDPLVHRGDRVALTLAGGGYVVSTQAMAMDGGGAGARVRVKTLTSPSVMVATVTGPGAVTISP
jgi:flagellar basal body P-ring formation protein FlgA